MVIKFIKEDKGQGSIEYILLAGGVIVAVVVIFSMYSRMTKSASNKLEKGASTVTGGLQNQIETGI